MRITIAILDKKIESVVVTVVGELIVRGRELLKALGSNRWEVASELSVLGQDHGSSGHEAVNESFLTHCLRPSQLGSREKRQSSIEAQSQQEWERERERACSVCTLAISRRSGCFVPLLRRKNFLFFFIE